MSNFEIGLVIKVVSVRVVNVLVVLRLWDDLV